MLPCHGDLYPVAIQLSKMMRKHIVKGLLTLKISHRSTGLIRWAT